MTKLFLYEKDIERLDMIKNYIEQNLDKDLRLDALAVLAKIGKSTLRSHFLAHYKQPIHQFVRIRRLERAKELLKDHHLTVQEIGMMIGYQERSSFTSAFVRYAGCPPNVFRLNAGQPEDPETLTKSSILNT